MQLNNDWISEPVYLQGINKCIYAMSVMKILPVYELVLASWVFVCLVCFLLGFFHLVCVGSASQS